MPVVERTAGVGSQLQPCGKFLRGLERQPRVSEVAQARFAATGSFRHGNERAGYLQLRTKKIHRELTRFSYDL